MHRIIKYVTDVPAENSLILISIPVSLEILAYNC